MSSLFDLTGRTALITGSTRGLGFAMAQGLSDAGATIIVNSRHQSAVDEAVAKLKAKGCLVRGAVFDVSDEAEVAAAFAKFDQDGVEIDILVNNAGIQFRKPIIELDLKDWKRVIDTNLTGAFIVGKETAKRMLARGRGGKIINIGSLTSHSARPNVAPYASSKGGIMMLARVMSAEWAQFNIQANSIGPGWFLTEMNEPVINNPELNAWVKSSNPAGRWGEPEELAGTVVYLASSASSYVTGQIIYVDGGWLTTQ